MSIQYPCIYILDDDEHYASLLAEIATQAGWQVVTETSSAAFLAADIPQQGILILDLMMPDIDGVEVIRGLAEKAVDLQLILISGFDSRVLRSAQKLAEAHNMNVLASLNKPVSMDDFVAVLDRVKEKVEGSKQTPVVMQTVSVEELRQGILQHQLMLYYQPQIELKTGALLGVEALVRWQHPERGIIFPDQFITLAEKNDLIGILTDEVIELAIIQCEIWQNQGLDVNVSVNVSAENIISLGLPEKLSHLTSIHAVIPEKLTIELTESAVMGKLTSSLDVLNRLRMKGFSLSIDDFGTGYSSLVHLYQAPFSEIKIDQQFIMRMLDDDDAMVIVEICIMLGKKMGMKLVAEGVETLEIYEKLRELGCDVAQGYFIARPMPADELVEWASAMTVRSLVG